MTLSTLRFFYRLILAAFFPVAYAKWVNSQRCGITIENDPSGDWTVKIGKLDARTRSSLRWAILQAHIVAEQDKRWRWTTDYLRELK